MQTRINGQIASAVTINLTVMDCATCGIVFAITADLEKRRRDDGEGFHCPNGHVNVYGNSTVDKLKREVEAKTRTLNWVTNQRDSARAEAEHEKRSKAAIKGQLTKVKKRVGNGVCPCCNRTFTNLQRHMHNQHPDFVGEVVE